MPKERPILFSTPMVQAILEGRKTMTRRVVKDEPKGEPWIFSNMEEDHAWFKWNLPPSSFVSRKCPYGQAGDILWVRETWCDYNDGYSEEHAHLKSPEPHYLYRADCKEFEKAKIWRPSIFMPRSACRLRLKITDIKVERLQDISEEDAIAEGIEWKIKYPEESPNTKYYRDYLFADRLAFGIGFKAKQSFRSLWHKINGEESWNANPWVWVVSFQKI